MIGSEPTSPALNASYRRRAIAPSELLGGGAPTANASELTLWP